jgi:cell division protein FtsZ
MKEMIKFDMPKNQSSIIKVIGVGGGGSNAVNHMFRQGIKGVDFIICNTDAQAMESSPVPTKIQLGERGLGAGSIPAVGAEAASQKVDQIKEILEKNTQMVFITAGMGGGTGTGAAPVIAKIAKELGILTVAIVTIPFTFEGKKRKYQADDGILELRKYADTMLIICNDKLRELCGDLKLSEAFNKADDVLTTAAKGIAEIITVTGYINVDFEDVRTVMKESGKAIMGCAQAEGENRAIEAVKGALSSPLLNDNDIEGASNVLLYITSGKEEISMDEVTEITDYIQQEAKSQAEIIWGNGYDESLGNNISITLIATGFESRISQAQDNKIRHALNDEIRIESSRPTVQATTDSIESQRPFEMIRKSMMENSGPDDNQRTDSHDVITAEEQETMENTETVSQTDDVDTHAIAEATEIEAWKEDERTFIFEFSQPEDLNAEKEEVLAEEETAEFTGTGQNAIENKVNQPEEVKPFEIYIKKPGGSNFQETEQNFKRPSIDLKSQERIERLRNLSMKLKNESAIEELENEPAYMRRNVELKNVTPSGESRISRYSLYEDPETRNPEIRSGNSYLHDNVD